MAAIGVLLIRAHTNANTQTQWQLLVMKGSSARIFYGTPEPVIRMYSRVYTSKYNYPVIHMYNTVYGFKCIPIQLER